MNIKETLDNLPDDHDEAIIAICEAYLDQLGKLLNETNDTKILFPFYTDSLGVLIAMAIHYELGGNYEEVKTMTGDALANQMFQAFNSNLDQARMRARTSSVSDNVDRYLDKMNKSARFEFVEGDYNRLQDLLNEMRDVVTKSDELEKEHKTRLLKKIEQLQSVLNKRMSSLDQFWALLGEVNGVLPLVHENLKELRKIGAEILFIVHMAQVTANGLPHSVMPCIEFVQEVPAAIHDEKQEASVIESVEFVDATTQLPTDDQSDSSKPR